MEASRVTQKKLPSPIVLELVHSSNLQVNPTYSCQLCGMNFIKFVDMILHEKFSLDSLECARDENAVSLSGSAFWQTEETISNVSNLQVEISGQISTETIKESKANFCSACNKWFSTYKGFKQHQGKIHRVGRRASKCEACLKRFKNKYALKMHLMQVHEKSTQVACEKCGKFLYNKYHLKAHLEKDH
ncbi:unnamed protein product [Blepharisma stoltei]|uniref:C2H2-type domain-containing protein n=1 Tax=Blepharisma stoltei TaxID=1481888 RepID=A0AAU9IGI0_9CILI|nr:unnamed protein product [Blepharisma stoltei]